MNEGDKEEHLMDVLSFNDFWHSMWNELEKHKDEKFGLKNWDLVSVWGLAMDEIPKRLETIRTCGPDDIEKQCIHISNYLYFLWVKLQEEKNGKGRN
jgi:hypothetical protein